jgi:hypothetical protein
VRSQEFTWPPDFLNREGAKVCRVFVVKLFQYTLRPDILPNYRLFAAGDYGLFRRLPTFNRPSTMPMYVRLNRL